MRKAAVRLVVACAGIVAIGSSGSSWAVDKHWAAKSGGNFERATSWSPRGAPGVSDRAIFDLAGRRGATASYTVKFNSDATNLSAWLKQGVVTWDLNGHAYTLTSPTESLRAGVAGVSSDLQVNDGTLNTVTVVSGGTSGIGSLGSRFGTGADLTWNNSGDVIVGQGGDGVINSGGNTTIAGNLHLATMSGDGGFGVSGGTTTTLGDTLIAVGTGENNLGQMTVFSGGTWNASGTVQLGGGGSRGGLRIVNGGIANLNSLNSVQGTLDMPDATDLPGGTLNIAGSATFNSYANTNADVQIGTNNTVNSTGDLIFAGPQSHVLVDIEGTWNHDGAVHIGYGGFADVYQYSSGPLFSGATTVNLGTPGGGGGELTVQGSLSVSDRINVYGGSLRVRTSQPIASPNPIEVFGKLQIDAGDGAVDINTPYISLRDGDLDGSGIVDTPIRHEGGVSFIGDYTDGPFDNLILTGPVSTVAPNAQFIKQGRGTLRFAGPQSYASGAVLDVRGGPTILDTDAGAGGGANLHVQASWFYQTSGAGVDFAYNGEVHFNTSQHLRALSVTRIASLPVYGEVHLASGGHKIVAPSVRVDQGALLDLADGDMIIDYDPANFPNTVPHSPLTALKQRIAEGYSGGTWDGLGIVTSLGDADHFGLGYGEAADLGLSEFAGESFDSTTALISFTRYGDANLDGIVNDIDVARFNNGMANGLSGWVNGDFNYDGTINSADGDLLAANYGMSAVASALAVAVPEPTGMAMVLTAASTVLGRRRRR